MATLDRRDFLKAAGGLAAAVALGAGDQPAQAQQQPAQAEGQAGLAAPGKMIAIQIGAVSFVDEGIGSCLDILQQRGAVNTILPAVFSYSGGTGGRHKPNPGHGKSVADAGFVGGNFATVHPNFYHDTGIDPAETQSPDHKGFDVLAEVIPEARKRGMTVIPMVQNSYRKDLPGIEKLQEVDFNGQRAGTLCLHNPYHRNVLVGLFDDLLGSYEIDGLMYVNETQGAFSDMIGARFRGRERGLPGSRTCFCQYCRDKAKAQGIRVDRVVPAFEELAKFVKAGRAHQRPIDGYYVSLWRLLLEYPELLQWEQLHHQGAREVYKLLYTTTKSSRKDALFGLHLWTNHSMSPIYRAAESIADLAECADFFKTAVYDVCGGPRMASYIQSIGDTMYGDLPHEQVLQFHYRVLGFDGPSYDQVSREGLGAEYVYSECKRAMDDLASRAAPARPKMLAGIEVDIPIHHEDIVEGFDASQAARTTPQGVQAAVKAAARAKVDGIVISRKYAEMKLESLSAAGEAIRELGWAGKTRHG